jgi:hypothetical protein
MIGGRLRMALVSLALRLLPDQRIREYPDRLQPGWRRQRVPV